MTATDRPTQIDFLLNQQTTMKGNVVRKSINKKNAKGEATYCVSAASAC
jgi:hypothetical protein